MEATPSHTEPHDPIFRGFDETVERFLGADMRLIYGLGVPILVVLGLIVVLALSPATWLVATILVLEFAMLGVVLVGLLGMLSDEPDDDDA